MNKLLLIIIFVLVAGLGVVWWWGRLPVQPSAVDEISSASRTEQTSDAGNAPLATQVPPKEPVSLVAVGDMMLSRHVWTKIMAHGADPRYPFLETADFTKAADVTFGNVETAVSDMAPPPPEGMSFITPTKAIEGLKYAGFDVVSLANNHSMNFGREALLDSVKQLEAQGIKTAGAGENIEAAHVPARLEVKGNKIAFFAYQNVGPEDAWAATASRTGIAWMNVPQLQQDIKSIRDEVDYVIISMHAGTEYVFDPIPVQKEFAHAAIDAGADLVIGHHPHVIQDKEIYKDKQIIYSLGNFVFDQMWSEETRLGEVMTATLDNGQVKDIKFRTVKIFDYCQPQFVD